MMNSREEILNRMLNDKSVIAAGNVTKAILALDEVAQVRIEAYLNIKLNSQYIEPVLRYMNFMGDTDEHTRKVLDDLDSLSQQSQWAVKSILKDKEILFGKRTA